MTIAIVALHPDKVKALQWPVAITSGKDSKVRMQVEHS